MDKKELNLDEMNKVTGGGINHPRLMLAEDYCKLCHCVIGPEDNGYCQACREKLQNTSPLGVRL